MNTTPRQNAFRRLGAYWNQGAKQKGIVIALSSISLLVFCCVVSVTFAATPWGQSIIAEENATATAQTLAAQEQSATATTYAIAHPLPTSTAKPTATVQPIATSIPTVVPTNTPLPKPTPTPLTSIPLSFMGLGGGEQAFINYFGIPDVPGPDGDIWDRVDINNEGPFGQVASIVLNTWPSDSKNIAYQVRINNPDYLSYTWNDDIQATAQKLCDGMRPPDAIKISTFPKGVDIVTKYSSMLFKKFVLRLFPGTPNANIIYVEYVHPNDGCIITPGYSILD